MDFKVEMTNLGQRIYLLEEKVKKANLHETKEKEERTEDLKRSIREFLETVSRTTSIRMRYDKEIDRVIVSVIESGTEKVIRQIPPEEFVKFLKRYRASLALIFEKRI